MGSGWAAGGMLHFQDLELSTASCQWEGHHHVPSLTSAQAGVSESS